MHRRRARLAGIDSDPKHWQTLRKFCEQQFPVPGVFVDVHYGFCLAALGDAAMLADHITDLRRAEAAGRVVAGRVVIAAVLSAAAFMDGDMRRVQTLLEPAPDETVRIDGSRAQRDLVLCTLVAASLALGDTNSARTALRKRGPRARGMPVAELELGAV